MGGQLAEQDVRGFRDQNRGLGSHAINSRWKARYETKLESLSRFGLSCWHVSDRESAALWELYVPRGLGVAVQSTVARVQDAVAAANPRGIIPREIEYIEYQDNALGDDPVNLLSHKRREFDFERELRFFVELRQDEIEAVQSMIWARDVGQKRRVSAKGFRPAVLAGPGYGTTDNTLNRRAAPTGIHLQTDMEQLIEHVYLAPQISWEMMRAVIAVTKSFGLNQRLVKQTSMDMVPFDVLEFHDM